MTKQTEKPVQAQSTPKTKTDDALSDAALDKIAGGKPQSSVVKKENDTNNAVIGKIG
jgi:hypothetical protein